MNKNRSDDKAAKADRNARLGAALRANLLRRKEQTRARVETDDETPPDRSDEQKGQD